MNIVRNRHWLEYDFVSLVVLFAGIGFIPLIVLMLAEQWRDNSESSVYDRNGARGLLRRPRCETGAMKSQETSIGVARPR